MLVTIMPKNIHLQFYIDIDLHNSLLLVSDRYKRPLSQTILIILETLVAKNEVESVFNIDT
jgi:hypothetical protein